METTYPPGAVELLERFKNKIRYAGAAHPKVKQALSLISNTRPNPRKLFVLEGIWAFEKGLNASLKADCMFFCPTLAVSPEALGLAGRLMAVTPEVYVVSEKTFARISERDAPDGLAALCEFPMRAQNDIVLPPDALVIVGDALEIPGNIGTILRSMDGCGADALFILNRRARLTHPKLIKGSMGAAFTIPIIEFPETEACISYLLENGFKIVLTDTRAEEDFMQHTYLGKCAIVMGSERYGISKEFYAAPHSKVSIPMRGGCDSLNVAIAASLIMYQAAQGRRKL